MAALKQVYKSEFDEVTLLEKIIEYIEQKYNPLSIILYGSYANGTNNLNSDFDALVISYDHEQFHDTSFVNDIQLDVFVFELCRDNLHHAFKRYGYLCFTAIRCQNQTTVRNMRWQK